MSYVSDVLKQYQMPFEAEVGLHPSLEDMQDVVVTRKLRPQFSADWLHDVVSLSLQSSPLVYYYYYYDDDD